MEAYGQVLLAATGLAFVGGTLAASYFIGGGRKRARRALPGESGIRDDALARVLRHGVGPLRGPSALALRSGRVRDLADKAQLLLADRGMPASAESLASAGLAALGVVFVLGLALSGSPVGGVAAACLAVALAVALVNQRTDAQADALRESIPEALRSMEACFQSGFSLGQTLEQVSAETKGSLSELFGRAAHVLQAGGTSAQALDCLRHSSDLPELAFVSVALDVQHQTGGSMRRCLESAIDMVEGELALRRSLRVQTAQARLSARVVGVMPFALIAVFSLLSEGFLDPFFESAAGMAMLVVALTMQAAGVLLVRSLLKVG
ncbi:MAG: type II secretion system F family protein [Coriobacteriia bacterium]|nr:type II secretion system F family protein [Coriobacteriia bacterium]